MLDPSLTLPLVEHLFDGGIRLRHPLLFLLRLLQIGGKSANFLFPIFVLLRVKIEYDRSAPSLLHIYHKVEMFVSMLRQRAA